MGPSRGHVRPLPTELRNFLSHRRRRRTRLRLAVVGVAALVPIILMAIPSRNTAPSRSLAPAEIAPELWAQIAEDLENLVPAALLLGGPGDSDQLDTALSKARISRASFQRTAARLVERTSSDPIQGDSQALMAEIAEEIPLPAGLSLATGSPRSVNAGRQESAVESLVHRLLVSIPSAGPEDPER